MAAFFSRHTSKVYRTQYLYVGAFSRISYTIPLPLNYFCIPPFARALKVFRYPNTIPLVIDLCDNMNHNSMEVIDIPAPPGLSPLISIEGTETIVGMCRLPTVLPTVFLSLVLRDRNLRKPYGIIGNPSQKIPEEEQKPSSRLSYCTEGLRQAQPWKEPNVVHSAYSMLSEQPRYATSVSLSP